ncbi:hypothetical protein Y032_0318g2335 [Ancylostoma ceylanicum]|uniref:Uncharacterized protein n=1 Tax=Ancylostoma ceylanicum TaxID=53326 RepID=A0A016S115_9BILA|nr:hypothetical protein Y032_0318g2335 [Ancylostoma ceylanicum]
MIYPVDSGRVFPVATLDPTKIIHSGRTESLEPSRAASQLPPVFATVSKSTSLRRDCRINLIPAAAKKPERVLGIMAWTGQQKFLYL